MACCVAGAFLTAVVMWVSGFVRYRLLGRERPQDPTAWRLALPASDQPVACVGIAELASGNGPPSRPRALP